MGLSLGMNRWGLNGVALGCVMTATFLVTSLKLEGSGDSRPGWLPPSGASFSGNPGGSRFSNRGFGVLEALRSDPDKTIIIQIGGQVRKSGPIGCQQGTTLEEALAEAGGATEFGAINRVEVLRDGRLRTLDLRTPAGKSFMLQQSDTVTVPEKAILGR